jgi:hypothetical protein
MDNQGWFGEFHARHIKHQGLWVPVRLELLAGSHFVISWSSFKHHTDPSDLLRKLRNRCFFATKLPPQSVSEGRAARCKCTASLAHGWGWLLLNS